MLQVGTVAPAPLPGFWRARVFVPGSHQSHVAAPVVLILVWPARASRARPAQRPMVAGKPVAMVRPLAEAGSCATLPPPPVLPHAWTIACARSARGRHHLQ